MKSANTGDVTHSKGIIETRLVSLGSGWFGEQRYITGLANYVIGAVLFWIALIYRELTHSMEINYVATGSLPEGLLTLFVILLLDFGYIGILFTSISQFYEGYSYLNSGPK